MERRDLVHWLEEHPGSVHGDPAEVVERCERCVRRHAVEDAWLAAKGYVEHRVHDWEREWGYHASEAFAALETCHQLAWELRHHEPHFGAGAEERLAGGVVLRAFEPEAREIVCDWILELAEREKHGAWREIVRFTDRRARALIRERRLSRETDWSETRNYPAIAAEVAAILARDYSLRAHPR
jgi:hypothetical protein